MQLHVHASSLSLSVSLLFPSLFSLPFSSFMQPWRGSKQISPNNEALHHRNSPMPCHAMPLPLTYKHLLYKYLHTVLSITGPGAVVLDARELAFDVVSNGSVGNTRPLSLANPPSVFVQYSTQFDSSPDTRDSVFVR